MINERLYKAEISEEGISALRKLLGVVVLQVFSPGLEVDESFISSMNFSIPLGERSYLILEDQWLETPSEYIDYHQISVSVSQKPKDIKVSSGGNIHFPVSSIVLRPPSQIISIEIHQYGWSEPDGKESVLYDKALILRRADGGRICIATKDSIADLLEITRDEDQINMITESCECRMILE